MELHVEGRTPERARLRDRVRDRVRERVRERATAHAPTGVRERIGDALGRLWAPAIAVISRARHARMFHPVGHTFSGRIEPVTGGPFAPLAHGLDGRVLARCSPALWRNGLEHFEVLGIALRIRPGAGRPLDEEPQPADQDLLFATIRSPLTMPLSPLTTDARDFMRNTFWAVAPFAVARVGRVELRLRPVEPPLELDERDARIDRLRDAVRLGRAQWWLEARRTLTLRWRKVAKIMLDREIAIDQAALRFDPFRTGRRLVPVGLVHAIRRATYAASQTSRPG